MDTNNATDASLQKALALLENIPFIDGHNDLPLRIKSDKRSRGDILKYDLTTIHEGADTDIPRLREGRVSAQIWACFTPGNPKNGAVKTLELIDLVRRMNDAYPETFLAATCAADVAKAKSLGKIASFIAVEGGTGLENNLAPLRIWYAAGARLMTLCHNETLDWIDSATDVARHGGLTNFGKAVVGELNRLGMLVDCAHVAPSVMHQVLDISEAPVVFSHSNAFSLCDHPRNVPDDVLARVKDNNGIVMATFIPAFISQASRDWLKVAEDGYGKLPPGGRVNHDFITKREQEAGPWPLGNLDELVQHIEYIVDKTSLAHVGIGCDFYNGPMPDGLKDVTCYPHILAALIRRGWSDDAIADIASGNFVRVFTDVERVAKELQQSRPPAIGSIADFDGEPASA
jgi:membrane dipeptidase